MVSDRQTRQVVIGVDVGGTKMAGAVVDEEGYILYRNTIASHGNQKPLNRLVGLINDLAEWIKHTNGDVVAIGVGLGVPGVVHDDGDTVSVCPGLGWEQLAIRHLVQKQVGLPVWLDNDVNVITLGEIWRGSLQDVDHGICVAIGTGLGAGIQFRGEIYRGANGASGEIGLWALLGSQESQNSSAGDLESYVAGPGILRRAMDCGFTCGDSTYLTAEDVFEAAVRGDETARRIVQETITILGKAIANIALLLDVQRIVLTGGVTQVGEELLVPVRNMINELVPFAPEIVYSTLGLDAGILGAVYGFLKSYRRITNINRGGVV